MFGWDDSALLSSHPPRSRLSRQADPRPASWYLWYHGGLQASIQPIPTAVSKSFVLSLFKWWGFQQGCGFLVMSQWPGGPWSILPSMLASVCPCREVARTQLKPHMLQTGRYGCFLARPVTRCLFVVQTDGKARPMAGKMQHLPGRACSWAALKQSKLSERESSCFSSQKDWKPRCCMKGVPGGGEEDKNHSNMVDTTR